MKTTLGFFAFAAAAKVAAGATLSDRKPARKRFMEVFCGSRRRKGNSSWRNYFLDAPGLLVSSRSGSLAGRIVLLVGLRHPRTDALSPGGKSLAGFTRVLPLANGEVILLRSIAQVAEFDRMVRIEPPAPAVGK